MWVPADPSALIYGRMSVQVSETTLMNNLSSPSLAAVTSNNLLDRCMPAGHMCTLNTHKPVSACAWTNIPDWRRKANKRSHLRLIFPFIFFLYIVGHALHNLSCFHFVCNVCVCLLIPAEKVEVYRIISLKVSKSQQKDRKQANTSGPSLINASGRAEKFSWPSLTYFPKSSDLLMLIWPLLNQPQTGTKSSTER